MVARSEYKWVGLRDEIADEYTAVLMVLTSEIVSDGGKVLMREIVEVDERVAQMVI